MKPTWFGQILQQNTEDLNIQFKIQIFPIMALPYKTIKKDIHLGSQG